MMSLIAHETPQFWRMRLIGSGIYQRTGRPRTGSWRRPCGLLSERHVVRDTGLVYRSHILRLPLRDAEGRVRLLIDLIKESVRSFGQATDDAAPVTIVSDGFIDLGAGLPQTP